MSTTTPSKTVRPGWDRRAWLVAAIFCALVVSLIVIGMVSFFREHFGDIAAAISSSAGALLAFLVFPPILSGIARRRTFFWAFLPPVAIGLAVLIDSVPDLVRMFFSPATIPYDFAINLFEAIGICAAIPVVTAGPVCLFRVFRRRANRKRDSRAVAMEAAMHEVREGVWPPAPNDQGVGQ